MEESVWKNRLTYWKKEFLKKMQHTSVVILYKWLRADIGESKFSLLFNEWTDISVLKCLVCTSYTSVTLKKVFT